MSTPPENWGLLKVFARTGDKYTRIPLSCTTYTIGSDPMATIKVLRENVDPKHCTLKVQPNGLVLIVNGSRRNPVPINNKPAPNKMYLIPNDTFSVVGKTFLYENPSLSKEIIEAAKAKNLELEYQRKIIEAAKAKYLEYHRKIIKAAKAKNLEYQRRHTM